MTLGSLTKITVVGTTVKDLLTLAVTASVIVEAEGLLNSALASLVVTSVGELVVQATLVKTLEPLVSASSAEGDITGNMSKTLGLVNTDSSGDIVIDGSFNKILGVMSITASGYIGNAITGELNVVLGRMFSYVQDMYLSEVFITKELYTYTSFVHKHEEDLSVRKLVDKIF